ncbi:MAG: amino acid carrier protein [Pseudohongiella nitratireducens]|nr:amino acid carrier protein [Pseudohongiella nitratireducens]MDF1622238.1 amino acid carrier protein [Pseudohongiella nitratireducens]
MEEIFAGIDYLLGLIGPFSDAVWAFPTQFPFYQQIPVLGNLSLPVLILFGAGIYFTVRMRGVQWLALTRAIPIMMRQQQHTTGISSLAAFLLGLAMRAGPGNIVGVTGAISVGGPGALFWMWVAALFGMATAFTESVLSQIYKEKADDTFVGGMPFYGQRLLGNHRFLGYVLALAFITYALFNVPAQTFNVFTAVGLVAETGSGMEVSRQSPLYVTIAILLIASCAWLILGGIHRVIRYTNVIVPVMAVIFAGISLIIMLINLTTLPDFFALVFTQAISPDALFGGAIGATIAEGVRRGLMSNEAGQGTITMAAAAADTRHPCEQGLVQSLGVFFDTIIICTLTGFIVVLAHLWAETESSAAWASLSADRLGTYISSVQALTPEGLISAITIILATCYALFAFTTLLGMISFAEIAANLISRSHRFILTIRLLGSLFFVPFGAFTVLAGLELGNLWTITDLTNITMVYLNFPLLLLGAPLVSKALADYRQAPERRFNSDVALGLKTPYWSATPTP